MPEEFRDQSTLPMPSLYPWFSWNVLGNTEGATRRRNYKVIGLDACECFTGSMQAISMSKIANSHAGADIILLVLILLKNILVIVLLKSFAHAVRPFCNVSIGGSVCG